MPWLTDDDSLRHNKLAEGKLGEIWRKVANETLERTGDEGPRHTRSECSGRPHQ